MKILLFGATGSAGAVLDGCVTASVVDEARTVASAAASSERFDKRGRIARWTLPLWFSATGVIVYSMVYQIYAPQ